MSRVVLESLGKSFGAAVAVRSLNLTIEHGEWVTLLGPSGCGKTTTLRMIAGFISPSQGRIVIGDRVASDPLARIMVPTERRNLGMVFQAYAVWPHMNVLHNVGYPLRLNRKTNRDWEARARAALEQVRLEPLADRYPHELSGGQQQRVALARALVSGPEVLLLDEPLSALDAKLREELRSLLATLHKDTGLTVIFVTHDQDEAISLSDRIVVMNHGEALQAGSPREIYSQPNSEFVASFIGAGSILPVAMRGDEVLLGGTPIGRAHQRGSKILVRPEHVTVREGGALRCRVRQTWFRGDHELLELETPAGLLLARASQPPEQEIVNVAIERFVVL